MLHFMSVRNRSIPKQRCLRLEPLENRCMLSLPAVAAVNVAGSDWDSSFVSYLESAELGTDGYEIPVGSSAQLQTLPWTNIDHIRITFSENVKIEAADLSVSGVNQTVYAFSDFCYDSNTYTATWTLAAAIAKDKLVLDLDADGMDPVISISTEDVLDGAWTDSQSTFISGDEQGGTDFQFRFNVLPGDADGGNSVNVLDAYFTALNIGKNAGDEGYNIRYDVDGSGEITSGDAVTIQTKCGSVLPTGDPVGMTNDAPTTAGISGVCVATNTADYVLSLPDYFEDAETASDDLVYSIIDNTNPSLFDSLDIDGSDDLNLDFAASTTGDAIITIRTTDADGLIVNTTIAVHISDAPIIGNFYCINEISDYWTLTGTVTDDDDDVEGYIVTFGGVLASYGLTAEVGANGVFSITVELVGLQQGTGTAQTKDTHGVLSNEAWYYVIA